MVLESVLPDRNLLVDTVRRQNLRFNLWKGLFKSSIGSIPAYDWFDHFTSSV